ncbi:MAG TPA: hypothetical protein VE570_06740 [Thermoleophilaceae bacterium]|jgi:hypothetical protein|nr:hypothetical protein [Thermoleophilaceae bacterium]
MKDLRIPGDPEGIEEPHDVLAAEEFAMPARGDYGLHLPRDPLGIEEPHDVLAAEEFAMPSGPDRAAEMLKSGATAGRMAVVGVAALAVLLYAWRRQR